MPGGALTTCQCGGATAPPSAPSASACAAANVRGGLVKVRGLPGGVRTVRSRWYGGAADAQSSLV
eukprot:354060-Chlamydomonas_euryale.AAC.14